MKDHIEEGSSQLLHNLISCGKNIYILFRLSFRNCLSCVVTARIFLLFDVCNRVTQELKNRLSPSDYSFFHPDSILQTGYVF